MSYSGNDGTAQVPKQSLNRLVRPQLVHQKRQANANQQADNIGHEIRPFTVAIDARLNAFNQTAVERKTEDDQWPALWPTQCRRQSKHCVGNQMMGFIGARSLWKSAEWVQRESGDACKKDDAEAQPVAMDECCHDLLWLRSSMDLDRWRCISLIKIAETQ